MKSCVRLSRDCFKFSKHLCLCALPLTSKACLLPSQHWSFSSLSSRSFALASCNIAIVRSNCSDQNSFRPALQHALPGQLQYSQSSSPCCPQGIILQFSWPGSDVHVIYLLTCLRKDEIRKPPWACVRRRELPLLAECERRSSFTDFRSLPYFDVRFIHLAHARPTFVVSMAIERVSIRILRSGHGSYTSDLELPRLVLPSLLSRNVASSPRLLRL